MSAEAAPGAPPGYAKADSEAEPASGVRPATLVGAQLVLTSALLVAAARELLLRTPPLYAAPLELDTSARFWGLALGAALGAALVHRRIPRLPFASASLAAASLLTSAAPVAWSLAFADHTAFALWRAPLMLGSGAVIGLAAVATTTWLAPHARALGLLNALLSPFALAAAALAAALALGAATMLPLGQAGASIGFGLALLCSAAPALERYVTRARPPLWLRALAPALGIAAAALTLARAELALPRAEVADYGGDVLELLGGERQRLALVSHRSHFELYVDRTLKLSSVDAYRYAEALVHPALAAASSPRRILLLGGGTGVVEREILRWPGVESLTVIATDRTLADLARRSPWLRSASDAALDDPRLKLIEAEPIVWLGRTSSRFDVIVADLEDPIGYRQSKHFTRHGFELLAARLEPGGAGSLQAPSPLTFPRAFASVGTTLRAAGLATAPYHAALPALGNGGFFLFARDGGQALAERALDGAARLPRGLRYVTPDAMQAFFHFPGDLQPALASDAAVNQLHTQPLVELYTEEHERQPER